MSNTLLEYVKVCWSCNGTGERMQRYCDVPISMMGRCDYCFDGGKTWKGTGFLYKASSKAAPQSVADQIHNMRDDHL